MKPGEKLRKFLADRGIKQSFFAEQIGISSPTMSQLTNGKVSPSLKLAARIEEKTGIAPREWVE